MPRLRDYIDLKSREEKVAAEEAELSERLNKVTEMENRQKKKEAFFKKRYFALKKYKELLNKKSCVLKERETALAEKEEALIHVLADKFRGEKEAADAEIEQLRKYKEALEIVEHNALVNIRRWEKKESDYIEQLTAESEKLINNPIMQRRKNGFLYEHHIADMLKCNGFQNVQVTQQSRDYGADVLAEKDGIKYVFQVKYYTHSAGVGAVREALQARATYQADKAVAVANGIFSTAAKEIAADVGVDLWDYSVLASLNKDGQFF